MLKDLTYRVVVIDDEVDLYEDYVEFIEEKLKMEGYKLEHKRFEELSDLDENPIHDVDLFLVDLKFGAVDKGPEFIRKIREQYLTDILFYSSDSGAIQANRASGEYQGVFFAVRDENKNEINEKIEQLIKKLVKRSNMPLSSRGIVLGCVAELDNTIKEKIASLSLKMSDEQRKQVADKCLKIYYDSFKSRAKQVREFWGCSFDKGIAEWQVVKDKHTKDDLNELVNTVTITDSNKNFRVLLELYGGLEGKNDVYNAIKGFVELLGDRNIFAHVQEEMNDDGVYQFRRLNGAEYLVLSEEKCRDLRKAIIDYAEQINSI